MPQVTIDAFHLRIKLYIYFLKNETMTLQIFHLKDKSEDTAIDWQSWLQHYDQEETRVLPDEKKEETKQKPPKPKKKRCTRTKQYSKAQMVLNLSNWLEQAKAKEKNGKKIFKNGSGSTGLYNQHDPFEHLRKIEVLCEAFKDQGKKGHEMGSPSKSNGRKQIILDNFEAQFLRRIVLSFYYGAKKETLTLDKIKAQLPLADGFPKMSRETLRKYIINLGFEFKKINRKLKVYERMDIVAARHRFLLDVQKFRDEGYKIYYQDETWCNAHHTRQFCWQHLGNPEDSLLPAIQWNGGFAVPSGEGQRLIICHAGSEDGFVQNSLLCFIGKSNTSDYHNEMNAKHFEEWWEEKLLPNLQDKSVVVIDNASIHSRLSDNSKRPNTSWRKAEIQEWLRLKNIPFEDNETNAILLMKVKSVYVPKIFMLEEITKKFCTTKGKAIKVLRLPVAHSELNPIELIWAQIKGYVVNT